MAIIKCYFIAQHANILSKEKICSRKQSSNIKQERQKKDTRQQICNRNKSNASPFTQKSKSLMADQDPTRGLARLGSRAALSFAFKFLKRAWRSGEDADLCSDILYESLDALQVPMEEPNIPNET